MLEEFIEMILPTIISILELLGIFVVCFSAGHANSVGSGNERTIGLGGGDRLARPAQSADPF